MQRKRKVSAAIRKIARQNRTSAEDVRREIQAAIDAAWSTDSPDTAAFQANLFPEGKPTPEVFIERISRYTQTLEQAKHKESPQTPLL